MYSPYDIPTYLYTSTIEFQYRLALSMSFGAFLKQIPTLKFLLYVPVRMPVRQYILCTAKTAQIQVRIIGALEYLSIRAYITDFYKGKLPFPRTTYPPISLRNS